MIDYKYLRPKKAAALKAWHERFSEKAELTCLCYDDAVILPCRPDPSLLFGKGGVIADGKYIEESGIKGRVGGFYDHSEPERSDLSVVYCGYLPDHWGHFLIEGVARLWYLFDSRSNFDRAVFIIDENSPVSIKGNYREFFELLGIFDRINFINRPTVYKKVYVPELSYKPEHSYSRKYLKIFDIVAHNALEKCKLTDTAEKVFLSRSRFPRAVRTESGMDMLDSFFQNNGYKILYPESISLAEMICYLQSADTVAAESGTLPHNLLFAQQGKHCLIMERQTTPNELQANIDIMKDLDAVYVDCHYMIYPVSAGGGPYFLAFNSWMRSFAKDKGLMPPDEKYCTDKNRSRCLRNYMKAYKRDYSYSWGLEPWMLQYSDVYYEAYEDSLKDLGEYLKGSKPFIFRHFLSAGYWKKAIKRVLIHIKQKH